MPNLREIAERDLGTTLEDPTQWGLPVELTGPDGIEYKTSANSPDLANPDPLYGQVLTSTTRMSMETGEPVVVGKPAIVLRVSSLLRVPVAGENWHVKFPTEPSLTAELKDYVLTSDRAPEVQNSIGFLILYPTKAVQSS